jgi:hypothetical protein
VGNVFFGEIAAKVRGRRKARERQEKGRRKPPESHFLLE